MAGESALVALTDQAKTLFKMAGNLGESFAKTKRFVLLGGSHQETIGHDDGKPITVTYDDGDTFESAHDLTRELTNKFIELGDDDSVTLCRKAPICIHQHATQTLLDALLEIVEAIKDPPDGFAGVASELSQVVRIAREILGCAQTEWTFADYAAFSMRLIPASQSGVITVGEIDPFAFVDEPHSGDGTSLEDLLDSAVNSAVVEKNEHTRQFWIQICGMPADLTYEEGKTWARESQARKDAFDRSWRDRRVALERLIETRCRDRMLAAGFSEDELKGAYVPCMPPYVDQTDPRMPALKEAMRLLKLDEQAMSRAMGCVTPSDEVTHGTATIYTLGQLLGELIGSESAYAANMREADRLKQEHGPLGSHHVEIQAGVLKWQPESKTMPGIQRIELICNERFGTQITVEAIRRLRAEVCRAAGKEIDSADALSVTEAADILDGKVSAFGFGEGCRRAAGNDLGADSETEGTKPTREKPKPPATVNERMAGTIMENPEAMGWNSTKWSKHLKCGKSTVVETATWKKLESARLQAKAERMNDRQRKPKASDNRRD